MREIICPHCTKAFNIDKTGYAEIQTTPSKFEAFLTLT